MVVFFFSSRRRHTRFDCDWSSDVCSSDLLLAAEALDFGHGDALHADVGERLAHLVELEGLDDGGHQFHDALLLRSGYRVLVSVTIRRALLTSPKYDFLFAPVTAAPSDTPSPDRKSV